jgi:hypothetical protein
MVPDQTGDWAVTSQVAKDHAAGMHGQFTVTPGSPSSALTGNASLPIYLT